MKQLLFIMATVLSCSLATAHPHSATATASQQSSSQSAPIRKGWDNENNPLYGNVAQVTICKKYYDGGKAYTTHHVETYFNAAGDNIKEKCYVDEMEYLDNSIISYEYYPSGATKKYTRHNFNGGLIEEFELENNPAVMEDRFPASEVAGKTLETPLYDDFGDEMGVEIRRFDAQGNIIYYKQNSPDLGTITEEQWAYDSQGRLTMHAVTADLFEMVGCGKETYSYDAKGRISEVLYYFGTSTNVSQRAVYKYDNHSNLVKITCYEGNTTHVCRTEEYQIVYR